jgi:hypothetical protein
MSVVAGTGDCTVIVMPSIVSGGAGRIDPTSHPI